MTFDVILAPMYREACEPLRKGLIGGIVIRDVENYQLALLDRISIGIGFPEARDGDRDAHARDP